MRLDNGSTTPVRIVPHSYGRSGDDDDAIDAGARGAVQTTEDQQLGTTEEKSSLGQADEPPHAQADADEMRATTEPIPVDAKATRRIIAQALLARPRAEPPTLRAAKTIVAELRRRLAEAEADFAALRDLLLPEEEARAAELAAAIGTADFAAEEELKTLARKRHWRLRDLIAQTCGAPQVSGAGMADGVESTSDEGSAS